MNLRKVSDVEYEAALNNKENRSTIDRVTRQFSKVADHHDLVSCGLIGLWRCLQYYREDKGLSFSSNLYRMVFWQCLDISRREKRQRKSSITPTRQFSTDTMKEFNQRDRQVEIEDLLYRLTKLSDEERHILEDYYLNEKSLRAISEQNRCGRYRVNARVHSALETLRSACVGVS